MVYRDGIHRDLKRTLKRDTRLRISRTGLLHLEDTRKAERLLGLGRSVSGVPRRSVSVAGGFDGHEGSQLPWLVLQQTDSAVRESTMGDMSGARQPEQRRSSAQPPNPPPPLARPLKPLRPDKVPLCHLSVRLAAHRQNSTAHDPDPDATNGTRAVPADIGGGGIGPRSSLGARRRSRHRLRARDSAPGGWRCPGFWPPVSERLSSRPY